MTFEKMLRALPEKKIIGDDLSFEVKGVVYDPLRVEKDFIFVAIDIYTQLDKIEIPDGHDKIQEAIENGARAVLVQRDIHTAPHITKIIVPDSRYALGILANEFYNYPSQKMKLIGITGTNGKTTTTHIVESIFIPDFKIGLIGTLYYKMNGEIRKSKDTTPEPPDLQEIFSEMARENFDYCVLEASSHGIDFHRLVGCNFNVAAFTNLSQDHLDYHRTMENYLKTKLKLFGWLQTDDFAIVNVDDGVSDRFIGATKAKVITCGIENDADVMAKDIECQINRTAFTLSVPGGEVKINAKLVGRFNVYNMLAAVAIAVSQNISLEKIKSGLEKPIRVSGRFELMDAGQPFSVVVDYAHTPDGLENVLNLAKSLQPKNLITVFGCGGDRDHEKRPLMGKVVADYSDYFIVTADNPRGENPKNIATDILPGVTHNRFDLIPDRKDAIRAAICRAKPGDIVMILGKGHETTQTLKDRTIEFNDYEVAEKILKSL